MEAALISQYSSRHKTPVMTELPDVRALKLMADSLMKSENRQNAKFVLKICAEEPSKREEAFQHYLSLIPRTPWESVAFRFMWLMQKGYLTFQTDDFAGAVVVFQDALRSLLGGEARCLNPNFYNSDYMSLFKPKESWYLHLDMVMCCRGIYQSYQELDDIPNSLAWQTETEVLYNCINLRFIKGGDAVKSLRYHEVYMKMELSKTEQFRLLRNTGTATYYSDKCRVYRTPKYLRRIPEIEILNKISGSEGYTWLRHPYLDMVNDWDVENVLLQVRGIWNKLKVKSIFRPPVRHKGLMWIWRSRLYVSGGGAAMLWKAVYKPIWDTWYLDLKNLDKWRRLPDVPVEYQRLNHFAKTAIVYNDYAWIFAGLHKVLRFNMISNSWDYATTTLSELSIRKGHKWPYTVKGLMHPSIALLDHFMYVYGGDLRTGLEGSDIFMVLDLESLQWHYLGDSSLVSDTDYPEIHWPPRLRNAGCWIVPNAKRFYLMYGTNNLGDINIADHDVYDKESTHNPYCEELWSYSIEDEIWTRERLSGNYPCPREDMAITYHAGLDAVIFFGGQNLCMGSYSEPPILPKNPYSEEYIEVLPDKPFTYFADTFIMDIAQRSWRQVVTRLFPCWMGDAQLHVDTQTGEIFLYGGNSSREFIDLKRVETPTFRYFTDVHRLDIEGLGNSFRMDVFLAGSVNDFKFGCWRRCVTCKRIGSGFGKCLGTCGGKYIYCSGEFQQADWKEHRRNTGCRKMHLDTSIYKLLDY